MELDGKLHPLSKMKHEAPEERQAGVPPVLTRAAAAAVSIYDTRDAPSR